MRISDWSSDVCSSDLPDRFIVNPIHQMPGPNRNRNGMELRVQAAFGASDTSGNSPFLRRLAAVRCAFGWVASIINWSGFPRLAERAAKILLNTPSLLHRMKRL